MKLNLSKLRFKLLIPIFYSIAVIVMIVYQWNHQTNVRLRSDSPFYHNLMESPAFISSSMYYREGELPAAALSDDLVIGTWMFESGSFIVCEGFNTLAKQHTSSFRARLLINFFGRAPSIHFLPDKAVNVYEQGDPYFCLARSGIWGFTPASQLFVEYDWNTYLFTFSSDMETLVIIDSDGDRAIFGKVYG